MHRLCLDKLPIVKIDKGSTWFLPSISLMLSDYERGAMGNGQKSAVGGSEALADMKQSLHALFFHHAGIQNGGIQSGKKEHIFALSDPSSGGPSSYAVLFISHVRFDLASHTFVLDGYLLPVSMESHVLQAFRTIFMDSLRRILTVGEEALMWKRLLPALTERCRQTWTHRGTCEYIKAGKIPLSLRPEESPICRCGQGKDVEGMRKVKGWEKYAPLCTRIAISPLFAVPYMESVAGEVVEKHSELMKDKKDKSEDSEHTKIQPMESLRRLMEASGMEAQEAECQKCGASGDLKVCSGCKQVSYCSPACQKQDWKTHKPQCRRA